MKSHWQIFALIIALLLLLFLTLCTTNVFDSSTSDTSDIASDEDRTTQCESDADCTEGICGTSPTVKPGLIYRERCVENVCTPGGSSYCAWEEHCVNDDKGLRCEPYP